MHTIFSIQTELRANHRQYPFFSTHPPSDLSLEFPAPFPFLSLFFLLLFLSLFSPPSFPFTLFISSIGHGRWTIAQAHGVARIYFSVRIGGTVLGQGMGALGYIREILIRHRASATYKTAGQFLPGWLKVESVFLNQSPRIHRYAFGRGVQGFSLALHSEPTSAPCRLLSLLFTMQSPVEKTEIFFSLLSALERNESAPSNQHLRSSDPRYDYNSAPVMQGSSFVMQGRISSASSSSISTD
ncbi:hypothetical protein P4N68_02265 [Corynebacterium felinum]|uniref:Uncharacterized protein n=1 Tax=Corynebacterium felinum TaxID=131318 RepID=A0ABU2BDB5_9CORY|nr:hypothetical protein [Corynebacterium felinum]MDF5819907.1 hypothetical protein [Corynebacterium felinum]MDR7355949.1 hypothetical protein [Corynebacterium felinum]